MIQNDSNPSRNPKRRDKAENLLAGARILRIQGGNDRSPRRANSGRANYNRTVHANTLPPGYAVNTTAGELQRRWTAALREWSRGSGSSWMCLSRSRSMTQDRGCEKDIAALPRHRLHCFRVLLPRKQKSIRRRKPLFQVEPCPNSH
jgi:hypothetical protein